jgi:hypothetical protein
MNPDGSNVFKLTNSVPIVDLIQILLISLGTLQESDYTLF